MSTAFSTKHLDCQVSTNSVQQIRQVLLVICVKGFLMHLSYFSKHITARAHTTDNQSIHQWFNQQAHGYSVRKEKFKKKR